MHDRNLGTGRMLLTVKQMANHPRYPWLTEASLRHQIFLADSRFSSRGEEIRGNGLNKAIIRLGRRVLLDVEEYDQWLEEHRCADQE